MDQYKKNLRESTGFSVFIYLMALLICTLLGSFVTMRLADKGGINTLKLAQGISSTLIFIVPPIILYAFTRNQPLRRLGFQKPNNYWMFLIGTALMFVSLPVTNLLSDWNEAMRLGPALESLERWMKSMEDTASALTDQMMQVDTLWGLLFNLIVIALIAAVGEELTFRGVLQQALTKRCNPHLAVFLSAFIFSFIHFQFYGFLPRLFLGLVLGYLFYYSGSLWTTILMHFVNNGTAVVIGYLDYKGLADIDVDHFGSTSNVWMILLSLIVTVGLIYLSSKIKYKYGRK